MASILYTWAINQGENVTPYLTVWTLNLINKSSIFFNLLQLPVLRYDSWQVLAISPPRLMKCFSFREPLAPRANIPAVKHALKLILKE